MDVGFVCRVLEGTLSADNGVRKAAEGELKKVRATTILAASAGAAVGVGAPAVRPGV
jgi:hypothetical protein